MPFFLLLLHWKSQTCIWNAPYMGWAWPSGMAFTLLSKIPFRDFSQLRPSDCTNCLQKSFPLCWRILSQRTEKNLCRFAVIGICFKILWTALDILLLPNSFIDHCVWKLMTVVKNQFSCPWLLRQSAEKLPVSPGSKLTQNKTASTLCAV